MTRILVNTWRRRGRVLGPVLRDRYGAEVAYAQVLQDSGSGWCLGVQWHPELMPEDIRQRALVTPFVDTCRARQQGAATIPRRVLSTSTERAS